MAIKPILFNTEMVRAIQEGRKTVTRRICKGDKPPFERGDILWVRETWAFWPCVVCNSECECCEIAPEPPDQMETADGLTEGCFLYRADSEAQVFPGGHIWHASIHMPKAAARIFLKVEGVRVERLMEITDREARFEGCGDPDVVYTNGALRCMFAELWDRTTKKRLLVDGWTANPWVWVIWFEQIEMPEGWPG